jgi:autotransporter-associated beta strand protein
LQQLEDRRLFATNITQYHVDYQSTGANLTETQLTSSNVNAADFGQLYNTPLDGQVYAEPLVLTNVTITAGANTVGTPGTYDSVVFVATQHDSLYAINAANGAILWHRTFLDTTNPNDSLPGATAVTSCPTGTEPLDGQPAIGSTDINPEVGITGTPVIDPSTNILYVLVKTREIVPQTVNGTTTNVDHYVQRLHAIHVADGTDAVTSFLVGDTTNGNTNNTPISVSGTGDGNVGGVVQFNALREANRPALSLVNGRVYVAWASHGDEGPYHGWVVTWNVANLSTQGMVLAGVLCTDPNGGEGGIWGGGGGLTFDPDETFSGQPAFYFETGNGIPRGGNPPLDANGFPTDKDYYESLLKVEADPTTTATNQNSNGWGLKVADYFTPYNANALDDADEDFGSGSPLVLPDSAGIPGHPHLLVAAGKEGKIYLIDRDSLGKFTANADNVLNAFYNSSTGVSTPPVLINGSLSTPAYYHGELYWVAGYNSNAWSYVVAPNPSPNPPTVPVAAVQPTSETANGNFGYLPGSVTVSANGSENPAGGIAWIMDTNNNELHAYSTLSLSTELWNSGQGSIAAVKFAVPTVANGQVFVGTKNSLQVFGLTGPGTPAHAPNAPANLSAQALSGSAVELTWTDSTVSPNFATNYAIQESTDGTNFATVANAGQEATSYTVTGLSVNTTYYFQVVGSNSAGSSGPSNVAHATTTSQTGQTPTAPVGLGATPASGSEVYLTWTNTASNETGFTLTRATDNLFTQNVVTQTLASAPYYYTDGAAGLSPGNTYYYKLQATNSSGLSSSSNTASVNIPNVPPAPTNASAVLKNGQVVVSWTDHAGPFALGYQISRAVDGGPYSIYADRPETSDSPPSTQTFTDTNVPVGHTYSYVIVAENVSGFSAPASASVPVLGSATLSLDGAGNLVYTAAAGVPDRLSVQLASGVYTVADPAVIITVTGAGAGAASGSGTSTVTIPSANVSAMTLDTSDNTDTIRIISAAVPITITADSGGGQPAINLGDPTNNETISGPITNAGNGTLSISGSGTTTITVNLICQGSGGVTLAGTGTITIAGNINLGSAGNFTDSGSGQATVSGVISGTSTSGFVQGLTGTYFNLGAAQGQIQPASTSNSAWLGNQTPAVTAQLVGPLDFPNIAANGFADSVGNPAYYNLGNGNNNNVEARWYGDILIPGSGTSPVPVNFATTSDDGSMLYIDGNAVVNNNNFQPPTKATGLASLTPGLHAIDVEFYQGGGGASLDVQWDTSGGTNFVDIPNSAFAVPVNRLTMTGTGTLTLSKTNTYVGATTVSAGTLVVAANGALGPATDPGTVVSNGGALAFSGGVSYTGAAPITVSGSGPAGHGAIENLSGTNSFAGNITVSGPTAIGADAGTLTLGGTISTGPSTLTLVGAGNLNLAGNISLGSAGNLTDSGSGQDTISGAISGTSTTGFVQGLTGTFFNLPYQAATSPLIYPAAPSNSAWLGNQTPAVTAQLVGPLDFPNIAANGFADSVGDPAYYNLGNGNNNNVEARWVGDILIPGSGTSPVPVNFATTSDDGSMLYIDQSAVVFNDYNQGATRRTGLASLTPGLHAIDVEFYQGGGGASLDVQWDTSGGTNFVDIPYSAFGGPVNALTMNGTGTLTLSNTDAYAGPTTVSAGKLVVNGRVQGSAVTVNAGGTLGGDGTVGAVTVQSGGFLSPGDSPGTLTAGSLSLAAGATFNEELGGTTAGTQYDQTVIPAGGSVGLGGAALNVSFLGGFRPQVGQQFTLLSNQSGTAVTGTFAGSASEYTTSGVLFGINYAGGAGHDVVLTVLATVNPVATAPYNGKGHGTTGQILGANNKVQSAKVVYTNSANKVLAGAPIDAGTYTATVTYPGNGSYPASSVSTQIVITTAATSTSISADPSNPPSPSYGQPLTFTATVTDATQPGVILSGGTVTFYSGTTALKTVAMSKGQATVVLTNVPAGSDTITAVYNGKVGANGIADLTGSTSPTGVAVTVAKAATTTKLVSSLNPAPAGQAITFTATITANDSSTIHPSGTVTFLDLTTGQTLATVKVVAGVAKFKTIKLTVGSHQIKAVYNPDSNFLGSSDSLTEVIQ